jgi:hypothetical protein
MEIQQEIWQEVSVVEKILTKRAKRKQKTISSKTEL